MGTRGTMAFKHNGEVKGAYNHFDSYPTGLGNVMLNWLASALADESSRGKAEAQIDALQPVPDRDPTPEEIERLAPYTDLKVSERSTTDWYCLLRNTQYDPEATLNAGVYYPADVGQEQWSYIADFDKDVLEIFAGGTVIKRIPFAKLPEKFTDKQESALSRKAWAD